MSSAHARSLRGVICIALVLFTVLSVLNSHALSAGVLSPPGEKDIFLSCTPSDTVLCLDDKPGDRRFRVTATYQTALGGGLSGDGQAIPLAPLGVIHGGLFWFFSPDNPEVLVKILNGCAINDHYWIYVTAGTNVGYTVTVNDIALPTVTKTYTNPDRTEALPVQDTSALASCHACANNSQCAAGLLCCFTPGGNACLAPTSGGTCPLIP